MRDEYLLSLEMKDGNGLKLRSLCTYSCAVTNRSFVSKIYISLPLL